MFHHTITLANGVTVPQLALGTWLIDNDKAAGAGLATTIGTIALFVVCLL